MAYHEFTIEHVQDRLGIHIEDGYLFPSVAEVSLTDAFLDILKRGATLALAVNTEKAKSEFIIAPLLLEVKAQLHDAISIFSGVDFNIDTERGLNGICDFIVSKNRRQHVLAAPVMIIVEAKNDNLRNGVGQCMAEMVAAQAFNLKASEPIETIYGAVTIGSAWKFLKLEGATATLDLDEYFINTPQKIIGILMAILA